MKKSIENMEAVIWMVVASVLLGALLVNSVSAMMGTARFAYWHVPTTLFFVAGAWSAVPDGMKLRINAWSRLMKCRMRMKAAKSFSDTQREARGLLASLFNRNNKIQTEP